MKQLIFWIGGLILVSTSLILGGCTTNEVEKSNETKVSKEESVAAEEIEYESSAIFENGVLETPQFKMSIKKVEIIQSEGYDSPGLFVTYELENTTEDVEIVPADLFSYFLATQENDTSRVNLTNDYLFLDAFGDENYNEMVDKANSANDALLPGKTIEIYDGFQLDNKDKSVVFSVNDIVSGESLGDYEIDIK